MRTAVLAILVAVTALGLAGCGDGSARSSAHPAPRVGAIPSPPSLLHATSTAVRGRELLAFRRVFGTDPLASTLTVYTGGQSVATLGYGGRNGLQVHHFQMPQTQLHRLLYLVRHTSLHSTDTADVHFYIYWIITDRGSYRLRDGRLPPASRPLIADLNAITDRSTGW